MRKSCSSDVITHIQLMIRISDELTFRKNRILKSESHDRLVFNFLNLTVKKLNSHAVGGGS